MQNHVHVKWKSLTLRHQVFSLQSTFSIKFNSPTFPGSMVPTDSDIVTGAWYTLYRISPYFRSLPFLVLWCLQTAILSLVHGTHYIEYHLISDPYLPSSMVPTDDDIVTGGWNTLYRISPYFRSLPSQFYGAYRRRYCHWCMENTV